MELMVLRNYRDNYLLSFDEGKNDVKHYYDIAPKIVSAIHDLPNANNVFIQIFDELVIPCVELIKESKYSQAHALYREKTFELEREYLCLRCDKKS